MSVDPSTTPGRSACARLALLPVGSSCSNPIHHWLQTSRFTLDSFFYPRNYLPPSHVFVLLPCNLDAFPSCGCGVGLQEEEEKRRGRRWPLPPSLSAGWIPHLLSFPSLSFPSAFSSPRPTSTSPHPSSLLPPPSSGPRARGAALLVQDSICSSCSPCRSLPPCPAHRFAPLSPPLLAPPGGS